MTLRRKVFSFLVFLALVALGVFVVVRNWSEAGVASKGHTTDVTAHSTKTAERSTTSVVARSASQPASSVTNSSSYFSEGALEQEKAQSQEAAQLQAIVESSASSSLARQEAEQALITLDQEIAAETQAELVLQAKGYAQSLVLINGQGAVAVVEAPSFTATDAARIGQAVAEIAGINPDQVQIVPRS